MNKDEEKYSKIVYTQGIFNGKSIHDLTKFTRTELDLLHYKYKVIPDDKYMKEILSETRRIKRKGKEPFEGIVYRIKSLDGKEKTYTSREEAILNCPELETHLLRDFSDKIIKDHK